MFSINDFHFMLLSVFIIYTFILVLPPPCLSNPCLNGGTCIATEGISRSRCICPPTASGDRCELRKIMIGKLMNGTSKSFKLGVFAKIELNLENSNFRDQTFTRSQKVELICINVSLNSIKIAEL